MTFEYKIFISLSTEEKNMIPRKKHTCKVCKKVFFENSNNQYCFTCRKAFGGVPSTEVIDGFMGGLG
jgi:hypothetical protein